MNRKSADKFATARTKSDMYFTNNLPRNDQIPKQIRKYTKGDFCNQVPLDLQKKLNLRTWLG